MSANPNYQPIYEGKPLFKQTQLTNGAPGTLATPIVLLTADTNDRQHINRLCIASDDTATGQFNLLLYDGTTYAPILALTIAIGAGTIVGTPTVDLLAALTGYCMVDGAGNKYLELPPGWDLRGFMTAAPTSTKKFTITAIGATLGVPV